MTSRPFRRDGKHASWPLRPGAIWSSRGPCLVAITAFMLTERSGRRSACGPGASGLIRHRVRKRRKLDSIPTASARLTGER